MEALLYFALWAAVIFLMMRFGCGSHVMGHGHGNKHAQGKPGNPGLGWVPPKKDTDPVCHKMVTTENALVLCADISTVRVVRSLVPVISHEPGLGTVAAGLRLDQLDRVFSRFD